jgi:hypothetical protein
MKNEYFIFVFSHLVNFQVKHKLILINVNRRIICCEIVRTVMIMKYYKCQNVNLPFVTKFLVSDLCWGHSD